MKYDLNFFDEFPKYMTPDEELDDVPNAPLVHFSVYTYQGRYAKHGIIPNGPTLCKLCEENYDIINGLIKSPTYGKKKHI